MKKPRGAKSNDVPAAASPLAVPSTDRLLADVRTLIEAARQQVAQAVNAGLVALYWHVGKRIRQEILGGAVGLAALRAVVFAAPPAILPSSYVLLPMLPRLQPCIGIIYFLHTSYPGDHRRKRSNNPPKMPPISTAIT
ncbi:MAG: DUF1016 N-terminal domain-containing protein [Thermoguttaceae bacterium]